MRNSALFLLSKNIHRYLVLLITVIGILMITTGYFMHEGKYFGFDAITVRYLHNSLSILFSIVLGIMGTTGLYLFLFPYLPVKKQESHPQKETINE